MLIYYLPFADATPFFLCWVKCLKKVVWDKQDSVCESSKRYERGLIHTFVYPNVWWSTTTSIFITSCTSTANHCMPKLAGCGYVFMSHRANGLSVENSVGKRSSGVEKKMGFLLCWAFLSLITVCVRGWITNQLSVSQAEGQECRSCWVACCVISCLRGLLVVVTWSALGPKITSVPAGDGGVKLVGHYCSLPSFLPQRMLRGWSW